MLPNQVEGDYDLVVAFTRIEGNDDVVITIPVGSHCCALQLCPSGGPMCLAVTDVGVIVAPPNALINGYRYKVLVKVRLQDPLAAVDVFLDGARTIRWKGKESSLACRALGPCRGYNESA